MGTDVEHDTRRAARAQGPFGPRAAGVVIGVMTAMVRVLLVGGLVMAVVGARAHRQLAGTKKPLWGTPRYGNEER